MDRKTMCEKYSWKSMLIEAERIVKTLSVDQIIELSDTAINNYPASAQMPVKRLRAKHRVQIAKYEIFGRLRRYEKVEL